MIKKQTDDARNFAKKSVGATRRRMVPEGGVIDPMMVAPVRGGASGGRSVTRYDRRAITDDDFLSEEAAYNLDDLYDENGALIMGEADEVLGAYNERNDRGNRSNLSNRGDRRNYSGYSNRRMNGADDFDLTEEELETEAARRNRRNERIGAGNRASERVKATSQQVERMRRAEARKVRRRLPVWAKILIAFLTLIVVAIAFGVYYFLNIYSAASGALNGNPMDAFFNKRPLAKDENGRTNILIFGTAEDDEGHGGAMLTDSILVISLDQEKKIASTFSVPRDLWVNYTIAGEKALMCSVGFKGKINATYYCKQEASDGDKDAAARYFARKLTEVTDVQLQYYVAVDFRVLRDVVNVLGGIDVDVHATDERGIYDICMHNIKLNKGLNQNLNGDMVLDLARARNAKGGYGLANSNFDREINQQRIINGIKNKALNVGILTNPNKVQEILESFGNNVKTNLTWAEMGTAMDVVTSLKGDVKSIDTRSLYGTGMVGAQSVVIPRGARVESEQSLYNYNRIHLYLKKALDKNGSEAEEAGAGAENDSGKNEKSGKKTTN